jgi:hypothetical protein
MEEKMSFLKSMLTKGIATKMDEQALALQISNYREFLKQSNMLSGEDEKVIEKVVKLVPSLIVMSEVFNENEVQSVLTKVFESLCDKKKSPSNKRSTLFRETYDSEPVMRRTYSSSSCGGGSSSSNRC